MPIFSGIEKFGRFVDRKRIQFHLRKTLEDLSCKEPDISEEKKQKRRMHLENLQSYLERGSFPSNPEVRRKPCFEGSNEVACAVGYLMLEDDREDLFDKVLGIDNNIYLEEIEDDEVIEWIESSGLTVEEVERIQPTYGGYTEIYLAKTCGPVACETALLGLSVLGSAGFAGLEWFSYKHLKDFYPEKPLKRRAGLIGISTLNIVTVVSAATLLYSLLP